jgi:hypothetical protein
METQGDLGQVWWIPLTWAMAMIKGSGKLLSAQI